MTELIVCPPGLSTASVQSYVSSIASNAFYNCRILTNVIFNSPSNVKSLNENVFAECIQLSTIVLPQSIESLSNGCFENCIALTSVKFEGSGSKGSHLKKLMDATFKGCTNLSSITFQSPSEFTYIGESTFENCISLTSIRLPPCVVSVGSNCFKHSGLQSIAFNSITSIGEGAFSGCFQLQNASLDNIESIPSNLFDGCSNFNNFIFSSQHSIGFRSFAGCNFKHLFIPVGINSVGVSAFAENANLESINISSTVGKIGANCFAECPNLLEIVYCGGLEMKDNDCGLEGSSAVLYVKQEFRYQSFCCSAVKKQLDSACFFLPPTPTNTAFFTEQKGINQCLAIPIIADSMSDSSN